MNRILTTEKVTWIDIKNPTDKDINIISANFPFHPFVLEELTREIRHPRIENYGNYLFFVIHYPYFDRKNQETKPKEIDFLITENKIITIHQSTILPVESLFINLQLYPEKQKEAIEGGTIGLLYIILEEILKSLTPKFNNIDKKLDQIEEEITRGEYKKTINRIFFIKKDILNLEKILSPQKKVFDILQEEGAKLLGKNSKPFLHEIFNDFLAQKSILDSFRQTIFALDNTNTSLLSIETNEIIKILTIVTLILLPLQYITNIFINQSTLMWILISLQILFITFILGYFKIKKWL